MQNSFLLLTVSNKNRISCPYVFLVVMVADDLYNVQAKRHLDSFVGRCQKTQGVKGKFKFRAHTDEDAPFGFNAILPAELQGQEVFVLVRL